MTSHTLELWDRTETHTNNGHDQVTMQQFSLRRLEGCIRVQNFQQSFYNKQFLSEVYFIGKILNNIQN